MLRPSTGPPYASPNLWLDGTIDMRMLTSHEGERQGGQFWACSSARVMGVGLDCVGFICSCHVSLLPTFNIHYISEGPLLIILFPRAASHFCVDIYEISISHLYIPALEWRLFTKETNTDRVGIPKKYSWQRFKLSQGGESRSPDK